MNSSAFDGDLVPGEPSEAGLPCAASAYDVRGSLSVDAQPAGVEHAGDLRGRGQHERTADAQLVAVAAHDVFSPYYGCYGVAPALGNGDVYPDSAD